VQLLKSLAPALQPLIGRDDKTANATER
jgi:hypothetical protein